MSFRIFWLIVLSVNKVLANIHATTDIYYHEKGSALPPSMWVVSEEGLKIFSVDGRTVLKTVSAAELGCNGVDIHGDANSGCFYFDLATDGRKYVWGNALHSSPHRVDIFSIDDGRYLGGVATCQTPLDMDYLANREELWIRCAEPADMDDPRSGHMSVIQANSLSAASEQVRLGDQRSYGYSVFDSSLGNYGYATGNNVNVLWKIDLANRAAVTNFTMDLAHSSYEITYSKQNKHLFIRSRVCCACGFEGADATTCGRGGGAPGVPIQTGPFAGRTDVNGTCGLTCEGSAADTLGVLEFDTVSEQFLGGHGPKIGFGATPQASPDGKYIVLFANDGGQNVRVLRAGENGVKSTLLFDVAVNFANVPAGRESISDFAFVDWKGHNLLVLASGYDNNVALIDLDTSPPTLTKIPLSDSVLPTGGSGGRMVEWAYKSDYIWINAEQAKEMYVLKLSDDGIAGNIFVERTITETASSKVLYVENFALAAQMAMLGEVFVTSDNVVSSGDDDDEEHSKTLSSQILNVLDEKGLLDSNDENADSSPIAIAALVLGALSLLMHLIRLVVYYHGRIASTGGGKSSSVITKENGVDATSQEGDEGDEKSLGSQRIA